MEKFEKIVWIVTGVVVLLVVGFIFVGPIKSEITKEDAFRDFDELNKRERAKRAAAVVPGAVQRQPQTFAPPPAGNRRPAAGSTASSTQPQPQPGEQPAQPQPGGEQPWQPPPPAWDPNSGVAQGGEAAPVYIPQSMADKYQHFEDLVELGQTAAGEDYITPAGEQAFLLRGINEDSPLSTKLGFMPGDIIISVNGYAPSKGNARQLWSTLKGAKDFSVVIERGGGRMTMPFHIR